ncbi:MAG: hypothetical protein M5U01_23300 [Ardenticatenaceae bacterium]|nr:hypothetical protein [Ardenticatenaceae bacterium]HBY98281.1 hypothetical protein [Chloroflexota bacterium]
MKQYDPRIARYLDEIAQTPTGKPLVAWVRRHRPAISFGTPITGGAFTYPWPFKKIVIKDDYGEEWQRETLAHELAHMIRWHGNFVGSLEQEYDAYRVGAQVRCEHDGCDWRDPHGQAAQWYPDLFGPGATPGAFMAALRQRDPFYAVLPWQQPATIWGIAGALARQFLFGTRQFLRQRGIGHTHDHEE